MEQPRYITQVTGRMLEEMSKAANLGAGKGLRVEDRGDKKVVCFDEDAFKLMVYAILRQTISPTGFHYVTPSEYSLDYVM